MMKEQKPFRRATKKQLSEAANGQRTARRQRTHQNKRDAKKTPELIKEEGDEGTNEGDGSSPEDEDESETETESDDLEEDQSAEEM